MEANDGRVVSNFIMQALSGKDITLYGDGTQTRSFCYVDDLISGMVLLMESERSFPGPVNLGNAEEFSMRELAEKIVKLTKSSSKIVYRPLPEDDPKQRRPDLALAKAKLGWEPKVSIDEGLERTVAYFRKRFFKRPGS